MGPAEDNLTIEHEVGDGWAIMVPAGTWHDVINIGDEPMRLYAIYAPVHHLRRQGTADRCRRRTRRRGRHRRTTELVRAARVGGPRPARRLIGRWLRASGS